MIRNDDFEMTDSNKHTPSLRFPEFLNDGEWSAILLKDAINKVTPPKKLPSSEYKTDGQFPVIDQSTNIIAGYSDDYSALMNTQYEDYIVFGDHTCTLKLVNHPFIQGADGIKIFRSKLDDLDTQYLYYYLLAHPILSKEYKRHFADLAEKIILFPKNLKEQIRIAKCFSSIDKQITATRSKLEQLKEHKRGLMQRLFPAKGKTVPELRFPEFLNDGEWEMATMESIFEIKNGYTPSKSNPDYWEGGTIPWFRMEDIRKSGHILSDSIQHITPSAVKSAGLFPAYSIIVATTATIGEHALIIVDSLANQQFTFLTKRKSFDNRIDMVYFHYFMFIIDEWCKQNTNAGGLLSVNMEAFRKLVIPYPASLSEQHKIAECFSSIDKQIAATKRIFEQLKEHQKGLMQRLFPIVK
mgnify:CR=1 FL=1